MVPVAVVGIQVLWKATDPLQPIDRLPALAFGVLLVALYTTSSLYHIPGRWSAQARALLCRCDGAVILLVIVGTFTAVGYYTLEGAWQRWSMVVAGVVAVVGALVAASSLHLPRWTAAAGYVAVGWLSAVPGVMIARVLPVGGILLIVLGGVLYTVGAVIFAIRRPDPVPAWFGFHEVFHVLVVAASVAHFVAIWRYVLPLAM